MTAPFLDTFGSPIDIGDKVVVAFPLGNNATLRLGEVLSFYETKQHPRYDHRTQTYTPVPPIRKVVIEWDQNFGGWGTPDKPSKVGLESDRFLKIK